MVSGLRWVRSTAPYRTSVCRFFSEQKVAKDAKERGLLLHWLKRLSALGLSELAMNIQVAGQFVEGSVDEVEVRRGGERLEGFRVVCGA